MVGVMCGILGCFIVLRNMALIGDALSHAILPGIVVAFIFVGYSTLGFFVGSVVAGLVAASFITWIQTRLQTKNDAAIGIVFTAMFSLGVMGISWISKEQAVHLDLKDFLFGNVLGVSDEDLYLTLGITLYVVLSIIIFYRYLFMSTFQPVIAETMGMSTKLIHYFLMLLLSFAVVASLRTVGVILVVAMLITPASTALLLTNRLKQVVTLSALVGLISAVAGLVLAIVFDTTPGPAMAVVATILYLIAALFSPSQGLVFKHRRSLQLRQRIRFEDILKHSAKLEKEGKVSIHKLLDKIELSRKGLDRLLHLLAKQGLVKSQGDTLTLTDSGLTEANRLVRAHRLWETYLVDQIGLSEEQIHEEAEKYEHLLTDEILDEVDKELGYPTTDPHGSPIPMRSGKPVTSLWEVEHSHNAIVSFHQPNQLIAADLWKLGILPGSNIRILSKGEANLILKINDEEIRLGRALAQKINVDLTVKAPAED
ncbi:UNVERIFIED_CONTAM: hypothetical protein GTU68_012144 [Idotea baltica]|nr:hypothetical protein [Idotea baltica]